LRADKHCVVLRRLRSRKDKKRTMQNFSDYRFPINTKDVWHCEFFDATPCKPRRSRKHEGKDVLATRRQGREDSAFLIPVIEHLLSKDNRNAGTRVVPRELAMQVWISTTRCAGSSFYGSAVVGACQKQSSSARYALAHAWSSTPGRLETIGAS